MEKKLREQAARVCLLGWCPDTLVFNILPIDNAGNVVQRLLPDDLQEELNQWKDQAQQEEEAVPTRWVFENSNLRMLDKAGAPFKWILEHPKIKVSISRGLRVPLLGVVRFSSEYLWAWRNDLQKGISDVWLFLTLIFGEQITLQPSEVELAVDFTGWNVGACSLEGLREHFISRAVSDDVLPGGFNEDGMLDGPDRIKRRWRRITGLPFGQRTSAVSALLYDKTHEIRYHSKEKTWFYDLWPVPKDEEGRPCESVWRLELRYRRKALHAFEIETVWDLLKHLGDLWAYGAGHVGGGADGLPDGWLRYVVPTTDINRSRWPVHPIWEVIQTAFAPVVGRAATPGSDICASVPVDQGDGLVAVRAEAPAPGVGGSRLGGPDLDVAKFQRRRRREVNMRRGVAAITGWVETIEAWRQNFLCEHPMGQIPEIETNLAGTFDFLFREIQVYQDEMEQKKKKKSFSEQVCKKRSIYHLAPVAIA